MKWYEGLVHREVRCMNTLQTNDWLILNSIIYRSDEKEVFRADEDACGF